MAAPSKLGMVARRLEADIQGRGLRSGDRYLTVAEAADFLGVSPATANRAMELLVNKQLLRRHHGRGTFIGEAATPTPSARVRTIFILLPEDQEGVTGIQLEVMVAAVRAQLAGVNVQFSFIPVLAGADYVRELIESAQQVGQLGGVIAISCPRDVYRLLEQLGVPAVVLGSLYGDANRLPSVDINYRQVGRLLGDHLCARGHKRIALLMTSEGRPGDHAFIDGVSDALTAAGLAPNALSLRIFHRDFDSFRLQVCDLLSLPERPTGVICGTERLVGLVSAAAEELKIAVPDDLEVVFHGQVAGVAEKLPFAHTQPHVPFRKIADLVVDMLKSIGDRKPIAEKRVVIDVELRSTARHSSDAGAAKR